MAIWLEWKDPTKIWVVSGNSFFEKYMGIFYPTTAIMTGNGWKAWFWEVPWLGGSKPKEIAPIIFAIPNKKCWKVNKSLKDNAWVGKVN
jgi:hypothetical protein